MTSCALVVGINEYPTETGMNNLFGAVADAADFADWALHPNGGNVAPNHLYFWTFPAPAAPSVLLANYLANPTPWRRPQTPASNRGPTFDDIADTALHLAETLGRTNVATRMYVFFAGHGVQTKSLDSQRDGQTCFVAHDFGASPRTEGVIPCDDLRRGMLANGFAEVVMFLDCCRTPVHFRRPAPSLNFPLSEIPDAPYAVGRASRRGRKAFEEPPVGPASRGVFSRVLMEGLRRSRGAGNQLTLNDLEHYVYSGVPRILRDKEQQPHFDIDPRFPPYLLIAGPVLPHTIRIVVTFPTLPAGTKVQLVDSNGVVVGAPLTAGPDPVIIDEVGGGLYSLETPDKSLVRPFKHEGPGATHVDL
jgi:Caspase domain